MTGLLSGLKLEEIEPCHDDFSYVEKTASSYL